MNATEVRECLEYLVARAPQTKLEPGTVAAWGEDMANWSADIAREAIRRATAEKAWVGIAEITAQVRIIRQERINQRRSVEKFSDGHCKRLGCGCNHDTCYRGWVDSTITPGAVAPCPACKRDLYDVLSRLPDPGDRGVGGFVAIYDRNKTKEKA